MHRWEYYRCELPSDEFLDSMGRDGWELVTVTETSSTPPWYVFKRPLPNPRKPYQRSLSPTPARHLEDLG